MIYQIQLGDLTVAEIEACSCDKIINLHLKQGYEGMHRFKRYELECSYLL